MAETAVIPAALDEFFRRWKASGAAERANYSMFLNELCDLLEVPRPTRPGQTTRRACTCSNARCQSVTRTDRPPSSGSTSTKSTQMPWSANLFLFVGLAFLVRGYPWIALVMGVIGSLVPLSVFPLVADPTAGIESIRRGCYVWLSSLFTFTMWKLYICIIRFVRGKSQAEKGVTEGKSFMD